MMPVSAPRAVLVARLPKLAAREELLMRRVVEARVAELESLVSLEIEACRRTEEDAESDARRDAEDTELQAALGKVGGKLDEFYASTTSVSGVSSAQCANCMAREDAEDIVDAAQLEGSSAVLYDAAKEKFMSRADDYLAWIEAGGGGVDCAEIEKLEQRAAAYVERAKVMEAWRDEAATLHEQDYAAAAVVRRAAEATADEAEEAHVQAVGDERFVFVDGMPKLPELSELPGSSGESYGEDGDY
jgi:hypothetical protein